MRANKAVKYPHGLCLLGISADMGPDGPFADPDFARLAEYIVVAAGCICFCLGVWFGSSRG